MLSPDLIDSLAYYHAEGVYSWIFTHARNLLTDYYSQVNLE